jgi:hypothetical protein
MKKHCPACGQPVPDEAKQFCPACEKLELSGSKLSNEDFERLSQLVSVKLGANRKFKTQIIASVMLVVLFVIGVIDAIVGFNLKENLARHFQNQEDQAKQRIQDHLASLDDDVKKALDQVDVQMRRNIVRKIEAPAIQSIIQDVVKVESKGILEAEVRPAVDRFREDAVFIRTVARAQAFDFKAYQRLLEIGTQTNDNAKLANQVVAEIDRSLQKDRSEIFGKTIYAQVSGTNVYYGPFTSDELALSFSSAQQDMTSLNREGFVNTVSGLKQPLFLHRLIGFFTNESDLVVADRLTMAISDIAKENFRPHDFEQIQGWWHSRKNEYTNWPFSELDSGLEGIRRGRYSDAANSFEQVLKIDPSADMTRALAIVSYFELGETNQALELAKGFKEPAARWAQWAAAMTELHTGNVSNATVRLAVLKRKNPSMISLPREGESLWNRIDWKLFHELTSTETPQSN